MADHDILTIEEVAEYLRLSERTVYDWASKGTIPCGKLGTAWRFKRDEIERWVDDRLARRHADDLDTRDFRLASLLRPDRVVMLESDRKSDALNELVACLGRCPEVSDSEALAREIFHRESLMSTGIGFNIAVPHARIACVSDLVLAMGVARRPIEDYASLDEQPVRIVCMVAARPDQHAHYLKTLSVVSDTLKPEPVRRALLDAKDARAAYLILTQ